MLSNILLVSLRNLLKNRGYTMLHILGLTLGITCALFITLYVVDETGYDDFHLKKERIHRIVTTIVEDGKESHYPNTQVPMAVALVSKYTAIEKAVRFLTAGRELFENPERGLKFYEEKFFFADAPVFEVFTFPLISGDPRTVLVQPNAAVLTQTTALRYFGTVDAIGNTFISKGKSYSVTGIVANLPANSSIQFDALLSFATLPSGFGSWDSWYPDTYVLVADQRASDEVEQALAEITEENVTPLFRNYGVAVKYRLQPITDIHLKSNFSQEGGDAYEYIYIFLAIGVFVILIACINYINMATARAARRAKEIGIRKTIGSTKRHIIAQFVAESTVLTLISLLLSIAVTTSLLPYFNDLAARNIEVAFLFQPAIIGYCLGLAVFIGLVGGSYPAFYLSQFNPALVLKGNISRGASNATLRKILVSIQFAISIGMLICTAVVYDQLHFMRDKDLGFKREQVLHLELADSATMASEFLLYHNLKNNPAIVDVASSSSMPGKGINYTIMKVDGPEGMASQGIYYHDAGYDYVQTMGLNIVEGRGFSRNHHTDSTAALVNEAMVKSMGWKEPIGKRLAQDDGNAATVDKTYTVVGVIKDYHQSSLHSPITPMAIFFKEPNYFLNIKIKPDNIKATIDYIGKTWDRVTHGKPFSYTFLDTDFQMLYQADQKRGQIFSLFSFVCLIISCIGLFGLAAYTTEQRAKEIGIRKVAGATVPQIMRLFYAEFLKLIAAGLMIACPVSYLLMTNWLQVFAYQTELNLINFVGAALITMLITMGSISFYAIRAAMINPANTLKTE
ncbi:MAG TPA: FtsX-like permease family protein [Chryseolinea sp.]